MASKHNTFAKVAEVLKDLPVAKQVEEVVDSVQEGNVTILTAETGSGKTLLGNAMLADASDEQVVVLVPRRFLAINAAETVASIAGLEVGKEVGFAVGRQAGDESKFEDNTKLLFVTYGYALSSGLINTAKTIVADEVHEAGVDTSIARAILHKRLETETDLKVMEMSATVNAQEQAGYYEDVAKTAIFHAEGKAYPCETTQVVPQEEKTLEALAIDLIQGKHPLETAEKKSREGIAIFRPGVKEIEKTVEELQKVVHERGLKNVEIASIYGDMDMEDRAKAVAAPAEGNVKILIGTNVIESGVNIPWLDTGISDGKTKVPYHRPTGASALVLEDLPKWRIVQQEGRVKRFQEGVFILHSEKGMEDRKEQQTPEITRISPMGLLMHTANLNLDPEELKFDARINKDALAKAKHDLFRLELLNEDLTLTEKGKFAVNLPVGAEAGAMLHAALKKPDILPDAIELAAVMEVGSLRADFKENHGMSNKSDVLDGLRAYQHLAYNRPENQTEDELKSACENMRVSYKAFKEVKGLADDMDRRLAKHIDPETARDATDKDLQGLILHGSVNRIFQTIGGDGYQNLLRQDDREAQVFKPDEQTVANGTRDRFITADLREIPSKIGKPRTIVQNITSIPNDVMLEFLSERPDLLEGAKVTKDHRQTYLSGNYFGRAQVEFPIDHKPSKALLGALEAHGLEDYQSRTPEPRVKVNRNNGTQAQHSNRGGGRQQHQPQKGRGHNRQETGGDWASRLEGEMRDKQQRGR